MANWMQQSKKQKTLMDFDLKYQNYKGIKK